MGINTKSITAIFVNFLFALGVILTVVGFIQILQFTAYSLLFDQYPLSMYEEDCTTRLEVKPLLLGAEQAASPADEITQLKDCEARIVRQRKFKQVEDLTKSIGLLISGISLFILFNPQGKLADKYSA